MKRSEIRSQLLRKLEGVQVAIDQLKTKAQFDKDESAGPIFRDAISDLLTAYQYQTLLNIDVEDNERR